MRTWIALLLGLSLASGHALGQRIMVRKLGENVLVLHEPDWEGVNMTVVSTGKGLVIVDALSSREDARKAREQIGVFLDQPIHAVINTNSRWDHLFGNQEFAEAVFFGPSDCAGDIDLSARDVYETFGEQIPGFEEYIATKKGLTEAHIATLRKEVAKLERMRATYDAESFRLIRPDSLLEGGETLRFEETVFEILHFGPLQTTCDLVVFCPRDSLLITSDIIYKDRLPAINQEIGATLSGWVEMLSSLLTYRDRVVRIVPSHGTEFLSMEDLATRLAYLTDLRDAVLAAHESGWSLAEAKKRITLPEYGQFRFAPETTELNVEACWNELAR